MVSVTARRGLSLFELLAVMAIIAVLASLLLAVAGAIRRAATRGKSEAIIAAVRDALAVSAAERGGSLGSVEHPLAGSAAPRAVFVRTDGAAEVASTGEALTVGELSWLPDADASRALHGDDRYQGGEIPGECELPLLYGVERRRIGVVGASAPHITHVRHLPALGAGYDDPAKPGKLASPYDATRYPDTMFLARGALIPGRSLEDAAGDALRYALAQSYAELQQLGAIAVPAKDAALIKHERVRRGDGAEVPAWKPGHVRDGAWQPYRLRGAAIYDAWGVEILVSLASNGGLRVESAGPDGVFRWHPGPDGAFATAAHADEAAGDDRDGALDNLGAKIRE
ncbi:MAG TPA: type II secretion system protein [Planctomycetota bacterium]|nr:type II secretion system protein [Planctomycetota bacterium]